LRNVIPKPQLIYPPPGGSTISYTTTEAGTPVYIYVQLPAAITVCNYTIQSVYSPYLWGATPA
jgi:hypothetical protein